MTSPLQPLILMRIPQAEGLFYLKLLIYCHVLVKQFKIFYQSMSGKVKKVNKTTPNQP